MARIGVLYRDNSTLFWLCVVTFVNQLGFGAIMPAVPLYARSFGVSVSAIGLSIAVYGFARFVANMPTGQLADRAGRRWTLVIGEALTALANLLCAYSTSYEQFLLFRFVMGLGAAMVVTNGQVMLADISTRANRGRLMSIYQGAFLFGVGFGPVPGGFLAEKLGLTAPFYAFALLGLAAGIVAFNKVPETRGLREKSELAGIGSVAVLEVPYLVQLRMLFSNMGFVLVGLVTFFQFVARTGALFSVVPIAASVKLGLSADQIGVGSAVWPLTNMSMAYVAGLMVDRFGRKPVIVPSTLLGGLAVASFALAPDYPWFLAASLFWGVAAGIGGPAPTAYAADMAPPGMNAVTLSAYRMISDFGYVIGPLMVGWMADSFGAETSLFATGAGFLVSGVLFALFAPETAPKRTANSRQLVGEE